MSFIKLLIIFAFINFSTSASVVPFISNSQNADISELPFLVSILAFASINFYQYWLIRFSGFNSIIDVTYLYGHFAERKFCYLKRWMFVGTKCSESGNWVRWNSNYTWQSNGGPKSWSSKYHISSTIYIRDPWTWPLYFAIEGDYECRRFSWAFRLPRYAQFKILEWS